MKRWNMISVIMLSGILLCGCGKEVPDTDRETVTERDRVITADRQQEESVDTPAEKVYNNGGNFVKVGDSIYYIKVSEEALVNSVPYGDFREYSQSGENSWLMRYDTVAGGEAEMVAVVPWSNRLIYSQGCFYLSYFDKASEKKLAEVDLESGRLTILCDELIRSLDPDTGRYVIVRYEDGACLLEAYEGRTKIADIVINKPYCNLVEVRLQDDYLVYCLDDGVEEDNPYLSYNNLYAYCLSSKKTVWLGRIPSNPAVDYFSNGEIDQIEILDQMVYVGVGYYEGSGHFLTGGAICTADVTKEGSLKVTEKEADGPTERMTFLRSALPEIKISNHDEYEVVQDFQSDRLVLMIPDQSTGLKEKELFNLSDTLFEPEGTERIEVSEYVDGMVYLILDDVYYDEERSSDWEDVYTLNAVTFCALDPDSGEIIKMEDTMVLPKSRDAH